LTWSEYRDGSLYGNYYEGQERHGGTKSIVDTVTPDFGDLKADGAFLPINPVTIRTFTADSLPCIGTADKTDPGTGTVFHFTGKIDPLYITGQSYIPEYTPSYSDTSYAVINAIASAKTPDWDLTTFFGELPETVSMLADIYGYFHKKLRRAARDARRRETKKSRRQKRDYDPQRALDILSSRWLAGRYGLRPLVYDVQSIVNALKHKSEGRISRKSYRHVVPISFEETHVQTYTGNSIWTTVRKREGTCTYRAVCFYKDDMTAIGANPVITAYELTKLSFVLDWFFDIGSWLQAISPRVGYTGLGISISVTRAYTDTYDTTVVGDGLWTYSLAPGRETTNSHFHERSLYFDIPLPSIQVNLNAFKIADLAALAFQGRKGILQILGH
jgi:hypothetical protein